LLSGLSVPLDRPRMVLRNSEPLLAEPTEIVLRPWLSLFRGFAIPICRLLVILFYSSAIVIGFCEIVLSRWVALLRVRHQFGPLGRSMLCFG